MSESKPSAEGKAPAPARRLGAADVVVGIGLVLVIAGVSTLHPGMAVIVAGIVLVLVGARGLPAGA